MSVLTPSPHSLYRSTGLPPISTLLAKYNNSAEDAASHPLVDIPVVVGTSYNTSGISWGFASSKPALHSKVGQVKYLPKLSYHQVFKYLYLQNEGIPTLSIFARKTLQNIIDAYLLPKVNAHLNNPCFFLSLHFFGPTFLAGE